MQHRHWVEGMSLQDIADNITQHKNTKHTAGYVDYRRCLPRLVDFYRGDEQAAKQALFGYTQQLAASREALVSTPEPEPELLEDVPEPVPYKFSPRDPRKAFNPHL